MNASSPDAERPTGEGGNLQPATGVSPFAPPPQYFRPPRLGIIHLLAWTAATAVLLKFYAARNDASSPTILPPGLEAVHLAIQFFYAAVIGAGVVGATVIVLGKVRGESGRLQPGHWFVLVETLTFLLSWMGWVVLLASGTSWGWEWSIDGAIGLVDAGVYFFVAGRMRDARHWKVSAGIMAIMDMILGSLGLAVPFSWSAADASFLPIWPLIVGATFLVAMLMDVGRGARRDWVHWLGVAFVIVANFLQIGSWVVFRLLNR
jgi:hypothetical protein